MKLEALLERAAAASRGRPARLLVVMWVIAAIPWLAGARTIPYDAKDEFYPGVVFTVKSLLRGEAPLWNPYLYSGYPSFADPQAMTFSPSVVLPMLVSQGIVWFDVVILLHLLLGGLGILRLGRSYGWKDVPSLVAALVFMFGGVAASRLEHTPIIVTWAFLPWVFVAIRALFRAPSSRTVAGLGFALGLSALQLTHVTYIFLLVICAYCVYRLVGTLRSEGRGPALSRGARLLAAAAMASLVAAPQLIATLNVLPSSNRGHFDLATISFLSAKAYLTLLSPNVLGSLSGKYVGPNDITETYFYIGAFPLVLLVASLAGLRNRSRGEPRFWTSALAFSIVYAVGTATPLFAPLHRYLPGVAYFRRTTEAAFLFVFCAAVLVGSAIDRSFDGATGRRGRATGVPALVLVAGTLFAAAVFCSAWYGTSPSWFSLALLAACLFCFAGMRSGPHAGLWSAALVAAIFVDLRIHNVANRMNGHRAGEYRSSGSLEHNPTMRFLAGRLREDGYFRVELRMGASALNTPETMGVASIGGLNPFVLRDYVAFVGLGTEPLLPRSASGAFDSYRSRINDLLGVRYLAASDALRPSIESELGSGYAVVARPDGAVVWENRNALPRLLRPRQALPAPPTSKYTPAMLESVDLEQYAYVEAPDDVLANCAEGRAERADIERYGNNEVVVAVQTDRRAWIVLNDVFLDGWRAEVEGDPLPIYRGNGVFRAVCAPPGRYTLRFVFEPFRHWVKNAVFAR
jgi:hypothetical protein